MPYIALMLLSAVFSLLLAGFAYRRRPRLESRALAGLMLTVAIWSGALAGEAQATAIPAKILWSKFEYLGVAFFPFFLLVFGFAFTERRNLVQPRLLLLYLAFPAITFLLALTNEWHHLLWTDFVRLSPPQAPMIRYVHGPWYWLNIGYIYVVVGLTAVSLLRDAILRWHASRWQTMAFLLAIIPPLALSSVYVLGLGRLAPYDVTSVGFLATGVVLVAGFTNRNLLSVIPVARTHVVEYLRDALLIIGGDGEVLDSNLAMRRLLSQWSENELAAHQIAGRNVVEVLRDCPELLAGFEQTEHGLVDVEICDGRHFELSIADIPAADGACAVLVRDTTEPWQMRAEVAEHQRQQAKLQERIRVEEEIQATTAEVFAHVQAEIDVSLAFLELGAVDATEDELHQLRAVLPDAALDVRVLAQTVHALPRYDHDFLAALSGFATRFTEATGLQVMLSVPAEVSISNLGPLGTLQLLRVVKEALSNVRRHAKVTYAQVIVSCLGPWLQVIVMDTGTGFDLLHVERLVPAGGLRSMRSRLEALGGTLEIRTAPGQGTHIVAQVPLLEEDPPPKLPPLRVVLVDDHPLILTGFADLLRSSGAQVVATAQNGAQALEAVARLEPDLVLMDIQMPDMSGIEATARIKSSCPDIKVVMLTASTADDDFLAAVRAGADGYLQKHLEIDQFLCLLSQIMREEAPIPPGFGIELLQRMAQSDSLTVVDTPVRLSERQADVLGRAMLGFTYSEIGEQLNITERTVRYHMEQARTELGANDRAEAIALAVKLGLIQGTGPADRRW